MPIPGRPTAPCRAYKSCSRAPGIFSAGGPLMCRLAGSAARATAVAGEGCTPPDANCPTTGGALHGAERLPSLTSLRFAAAGGVVYTHSMLLINHRLSRTLGPEVWV